MIKKKNNAYELIKKNIAKLALIQQTTEISPKRLVTIFLKGYWDWKLVDDTAYKYFQKALKTYLKNNRDNPAFHVMQEHVKSSYLTKQYFGEGYSGLILIYSSQERFLKNSARDAFIAANPITPGMLPKEIAIRNQRLGKISVKHWIGDIINYEYFSQAPGAMISNVQQALQYIDLYIVNLLNEEHLDHEILNLSINQRLQYKLTPRESKANSKSLKI